MTEKELNEYKLTLEGKNSEELQALEVEVMKEADKINEDVMKKEFEMSDDNYPVVAEAIRYFINKQTIQWQYALAMVSMYDFWNPEERADSIPYTQLDSVLRTLGSLQFTGYDEWAMVIAINKYFEPLRKEYMEETQKIYDIATKHNAIMEKLDIVTPLAENAAE